MAENDVRSRWTILSTVTASDLSNCQHHHDMTIETPNTGWGEPTLFCSISPRHDHWEWHMSKTPPPKHDHWENDKHYTQQVEENQLNVKSRRHCHWGCKGGQYKKSWSRNIWLKIVVDHWLITCASFHVCFSFPHWVQVRRSQADKPIHSPRDSLISWR